MRQKLLNGRQSKSSSSEKRKRTNKRTVAISKRNYPKRYGSNSLPTLRLIGNVFRYLKINKALALLVKFDGNHCQNLCPIASPTVPKLI